MKDNIIEVKNLKKHFLNGKIKAIDGVIKVRVI